MKFSKTYNPKDWEAKIYQKWLESDAFKLQNKQDAFVILLPPPNANAPLHIGHALDFNLKDIIGRHQRQLNRGVLLLPGADHAGFETWVVYEKHLASLGQTRFDFSRDELFVQVWDFVEANKHKVRQQIQAFGISCDWDRFTYSLDKSVVDFAQQTFKKMWQADLIYRGHRLVNYCLKHGTSFADLEVEFQEDQIKLYQIKYFTEDDQNYLTVSTTRPETLLADVALAVHPDDPIWQKYRQTKFKVPISQRLIPLIADSAVDRQFGTGVLKITPGHDFVDAEIAENHKLPALDLFSDDGRLVEADFVPKQFQKKTIKQAREKIVADLSDNKHLGEVVDYSTNRGHCYKCGSVLEPIRKQQWFINMKPLVKKALTVLESGQIKFYPDSKRRETIAYLEQLKDWNISRQIVWGIPIPMFNNQDQPDDWIFDLRVDQETITVDGQVYQRDPDVFDTWWSSGQWPLVTLDWKPDQDNKLYPTTLMETGADILRAWVARMIMLGLFVTDQIPFESVYLHGMVVDEKGAKMSKSKGNVVNPIEVIDQYGADALRLGLISGISPGQKQPFVVDKIKAGRNFCNKLWNVGRFLDGLGQSNQTTIADDWINRQFNQAVESVCSGFVKYNLNETYEAIYRFVWNDLADWYLEVMKNRPNKNHCHLIVNNSLCLVHPWMPFVSEALYQQLNPDNDQLLINQLLPEKLEFNQGRADQFQHLVDVVKRIRHYRAYLTDKDATIQLVADTWRDNFQLELIEHLAKLPVTFDEVDLDGRKKLIIDEGQTDSGWLIVSQDSFNNYQSKLEKQIADLEQQLHLLQNRIQAKDYVNKAPVHLVNQTRTQIDDNQKMIKDLQTIRSELQ